MKKKYRLLKNEDFQKVMDGKRFVSNQSFALHYLPKDIAQLRLGISVGKKLGGAVVRNRIKRQVRMMSADVFDLNEAQDIVLLVRKGYLEKDYQDNIGELQSLYQKIKRGES